VAVNANAKKQAAAMEVAFPMTVPTTGSAASTHDALQRREGTPRLTRILAKLRDPDERKEYESDHLGLLETEHRKFLPIHLALRDREIVPCKLAQNVYQAEYEDARPKARCIHPKIGIEPADAHALRLQVVRAECPDFNPEVE
jgi:hypothetical protein